MSPSQHSKDHDSLELCWNLIVDLKSRMKKRSLLISFVDHVLKICLDFEIICFNLFFFKFIMNTCRAR